MTELGVILHYNKTTMEDMVILDPQWLTKLMATLITSKPNFVKNGMLPHSVLKYSFLSFLPNFFQSNLESSRFPRVFTLQFTLLTRKIRNLFPIPRRKGIFLSSTLSCHSRKASRARKASRTCRCHYSLETSLPLQLPSFRFL